MTAETHIVSFPVDLDWLSRTLRTARSDVQVEQFSSSGVLADPKLVEAAGIEPASEKGHCEEPTCLVHSKISAAGCE